MGCLLYGQDLFTSVHCSGHVIWLNETLLKGGAPIGTASRLTMSRAFSLALLAAAFGAVAFIGSPKRVESSSTAMRAGEIGDPTRSAGLLEHHR